MKPNTKKEIRKKIQESIIKTLEELSITHPSKKLTRLTERAAKRIAKQIRIALKKKSRETEA